MKIMTLSIAGLGCAKADKTTAKSGGCYYSLRHGEAGRGRWEVRFPLAAREFPCGESSPESTPLEGDYKLIALGQSDARGNPMHLLVPGTDDGATMVLWSLSPGFRGGASYHVAGAGRVLAEGEEAQGEAGRMGGASCPIVLVNGPCQLSWRRTGRLYGNPAEWVAIYDGQEWSVGSTDQCAAEEAAMTW